MIVSLPVFNSTPYLLSLITRAYFWTLPGFCYGKWLVSWSSSPYTHRFWSQCCQWYLVSKVSYHLASYVHSFQKCQFDPSVIMSHFLCPSVGYASLKLLCCHFRDFRKQQGWAHQLEVSVTPSLLTSLVRPHNTPSP